jgi:hypothetical protein
MAATPKPERKKNAKEGGDYKAYTKDSKAAVKKTAADGGRDAMTVKSKTGATRPYSKTTIGSTSKAPTKKK